MKSSSKNKNKHKNSSRLGTTVQAWDSFAVIGAGSWGTALALMLATAKRQVGLWTHDEQHCHDLKQARCNDKYLPGYDLPDNITILSGLEQAADFDHTLIAVPSSGFTDTITKLQPVLRAQGNVLWATKGLDHASGLFLSQIAEQVLGKDVSQSILTGPSFAVEVAAGQPTAVLLASNNTAVGARLCQQLQSPKFRIYQSEDLIGAQLGGAIKNVLAIAVGVADGMGFGRNTQAMLITRGLAEMTRLGLALGAKTETLSGLSGLGDLILTCSDNKSRNRRFGNFIGQGQSIDAAIAKVGQVVEGVATSRLIAQLAVKYNVNMPITKQVHLLLHQQKPLAQSFEDLLMSNSTGA